MTVADCLQKKKAICSGCQACGNVCPTGAISYCYDDEGFLYPKLNQSVCINCQKCISVCPCLNEPQKNAVQETFACKCVDLEERISSSSGGIFAVLARIVLQKGGYVCGAVFDPDFLVKHKLISDEKELDKLKGTKYVQSQMNGLYSDIKVKLESGSLVLFSGTPCQVAGLFSFLGKDYSNLITIDIICHGVPSPIVWQQYLKEISHNRVLKEVNFRNKGNGINDATMDFIFDDNSIDQYRLLDNPYYRGFINNYFLRPSCFECKFKGLKRCSDITIGDFWAIKEFYPYFADNYGVSAVIIRTKKAKKMLKESEARVELIPVKAKHLSVWNENLLQSVELPSERELFYSSIKNGKGIIETIESIRKPRNTEDNRKSVIDRIKRKIWKR